MDRPDYVVSDVHLGAVPWETEQAFLRFLEHAGAEAARLLLPGDLFDFWFEWGRLIEGRHFRVLAALAAMVDAGVPVTMVGGNHDAWGGDFLRDEVGLTFVTGELRLRFGDRETLVVHGDGLGTGDLRYRLLKAVIRGRPARAAFRALHPELGLALAQRVSTTEAKADNDPAHRGRARFIEQWARELLAARPELALVVCGHSHVPALVEVAPGRHYLNAGDWVTHRSYAVVAAGQAPELREWR